MATLALLLVTIGYAQLSKQPPSTAVEAEAVAARSRALALKDVVGGSNAVDQRVSAVNDAAECAVAQDQKDTETIDKSCDAQVAAAGTVDAALVQLRSEVADLEVVVTGVGGEDAKDAVQALDPIPEASLPPSSASGADAAEAGAEEVVASLPGQGKPSITFEAVTWLVLVGVALLGWRIVERRSAQQLTGPVEAELVVAKADTGTPVAPSPPDPSAAAAP